jgi:hypothetical protein
MSKNSVLQALGGFLIGQPPESELARLEGVVDRCGFSGGGPHHTASFYLKLSGSSRIHRLDPVFSQAVSEADLTLSKPGDRVRIAAHPYSRFRDADVDAAQDGLVARLLEFVNETLRGGDGRGDCGG